jgi:hypothetical protein
MRQIFAISILAVCVPNFAKPQAISPTIDYAAIASADAAANKKLDALSAKRAEEETRRAAEPEPVPTREELLEQRKRAVHSIEIAERMLKARSYAARSEIYCRDQMAGLFIRTKFLTGGISPDQFQAIYLRLLREEPQTREGEEERQRNLQKISLLLGQYEQNVQQCESGLVYYFAMPSDAAELEKSHNAQEEIRRIDRLLAAGK